MVDIEVQTQSQVIQADSEGEADPTYSPSYLSGDDDIYLDDETLASFMSKKKAKASVQPPSDEDNEQSDKDSPPNWIPPPPDEDVTPLMVSCPMPSSQLVMMTFMPTPRLPPRHGQNQG
ncbi:hypothetical protein JHK82_043370 [Glycine max]|nr:hypothetical protein JHK82_043370 [Glycine max]